MALTLWMASLCGTILYLSLQIESFSNGWVPAFCVVLVSIASSLVSGSFRELGFVLSIYKRCRFDSTQGDAKLLEEIRLATGAASMGHKDLRERLVRSEHPFLSKIGRVIQLSYGEMPPEKLAAYIDSLLSAEYAQYNRAIQVGRLWVRHVLVAGVFASLLGLFLSLGFAGGGSTFPLFAWCVMSSLTAAVLAIGVVRPIFDRIQNSLSRSEQQWSVVTTAIIPLVNGYSSHLVKQTLSADSEMRKFNYFRKSNLSEAA